MKVKPLLRKKPDITNEIENIKMNNLISSHRVQWYIFSIPFDNLWSLIKNPSKFGLITNNLYPGVHVNPLKISKNQFIDINNAFSIHIDNKIKVKFHIVDIIETDYFCQIKWSTKSNIEQTSFFLMATLNKLSDEQTLYSLTFSNKINNQQNNENILIKEEPQTSILQKSNNHFDVYTYYIKIVNCVKTIFQTQTETNLICASFYMAKEYFLNARVCTQMMGEVISTTDERIKSGSIVVYINEKNGKKCIIQVRHCHVKKYSCLLIFYIYEGNYSSYPTRELRVELFSVNDNETFVSLTHNFIKPISNEEMQMLSLGKKKLLKKLGNVIEKTFKLNYSNKQNEE